MAQEVKRQGGQIPKAQDWARRLGWEALFAPSVIKEVGQSGGVSIFYRRHLRVWSFEVDGAPTILIPGRLDCAFMRLSELGLLVIYAVYAITGESYEGGNLQVLKCLGNHILSHGIPFIAGGDWQEHPEVLQQALKDAGMKAVVVYPQQSTFVSGKATSLIDFFRGIGRNRYVGAKSGDAHKHRARATSTGSHVSAMVNSKRSGAGGKKNEGCRSGSKL